MPYLPLLRGHTCVTSGSVNSIRSISVLPTHRFGASTARARHGVSLPHRKSAALFLCLSSSESSPLATSSSDKSRVSCEGIRAMATETPVKVETDEASREGETSQETTSSASSWRIKMLYDGECPLCMREVNMLAERNKTYGAIKFVDISADDYFPEDHNGIDFVTAMGRVHAILPDGTVLTNVSAFRRLYEEVGLGWVYAITNYQPWASLADAAYSFWAKYRLPVTGRPPLAEILEEKRRKREEAEVCDITNRRCRTEE